MRFVNIYDAKTHLSQYMKQVDESGDPVVICKNGRPVAQLIKYVQKTERHLGLWKNKLSIHDDFDDMPEDWQKHFQ